MTFGEALTSCVNKFATFSGRASRSEYWWWYLFTFVLGLVTMAIDTKAGLIIRVDAENTFGIISIATSLVLFLPSLAVTVRRYHDTNHSGWWILCPIVHLVLLFLPSTQDENKYGAAEE